MDATGPPAADPRRVGDANGKYIEQSLEMISRSVEPKSGLDTSLQIGEDRRQTVLGSHVTHGEPELGCGCVRLSAAARPGWAAAPEAGRCEFSDAGVPDVQAGRLSLLRSATTSVFPARLLGSGFEMPD